MLYFYLSDSTHWFDSRELVSPGGYLDSQTSETQYFESNRLQEYASYIPLAESQNGLNPNPADPTGKCYFVSPM